MAKNNDLDDFTDNDVDIGSTGALKQFENYEMFDTEAKHKEIKNTAKNYIESLCKVHLNLDLINNEEYASAMQSIETQNLVTMLKQVHYSEHILDGLMRQLDNGGYMEPSIFDTIRNMQKSAIQITLEVSKYTRTLPEYLKYAAKEILNTQTMQILAGSEKVIAYIDITAESNSDTFSHSGPQRGLHEMMANIADARDELKQRIADSPEIENMSVATDIDDEEEHYESLENDLEDDD